MVESPPIGVLGAGSWGTALAILLGRKGLPVSLWCRDEQQAAHMRAQGRNPRYLSGHDLPAGVEILSGWTPRLPPELPLLVLAVPVQGVRAVLERLAGHIPSGAIRLSVAKGLERSTMRRVSEVVQEVLGPGGAAAALSGPSFAEEVARGEPTAVTVASHDEAAADVAQRLLATPRFRVYTSEDVVGVELAGALKNVMAIAAGIVEGLELGRNTLAALITRGLAEIRRLGEALGGRAETFLGLAGVGDLVLTATSDLSRNRRVGLEVGRGRKLPDVLADMSMVAEGVETSFGALDSASGVGVELPITQAVQEVLFEGKPPREAVWELMTRELKAEE